MRSRLNKVLAFLGILSFIMSATACQGATVPPAASTLGGESPLARESSHSMLPTLEPVPTPSPGKGVVVGKLTTEDTVSRIGLSIFLGDIIDVGDGSHAAFLNRQTAPIGRLDVATGRFLFVDTPPGEYSFIISDVEAGGRAYMAPSGDVQVVRVVANQITDLGDISLGP
jgi:hypothetical protein